MATQMRRRHPPIRENLEEYLRVTEAAALLGVSPGTLRNWGRAGRIPERRHPVNGYRLYRRIELERLLDAAAKAHRPRAADHDPGRATRDKSWPGG